MDLVFAGLVALFAGAGGSLVVGIMQRPKTTAEAGERRAAGEVALSADARAWANEFRGEAAAAAKRAAECEERIDALEEKFAIAIDVIKDQRNEIVALGGHPKPYPAALVPPLPSAAQAG